MFTVRVLTIEDYEAVYALWRSVPGMGLNDLDDSREGIARYLARNPTTSFAAEAEGRLIGVILAGHDGRRGYIHHTAVDPAHRGQGVGRALVEHAMDALERAGIHKAALVAFTRNEAGNAFWARLGFSARDDLTYRNRNIHELVRMDT